MNPERSLLAEVIAVALALVVPAPVLAELPGSCAGLGEALTEHSCFHVVFGPTSTAMATPGSTPTAATPHIDSVHTQFRVALPTPEGTNTVLYTPERSGQWLVFLQADVPIVVVNEAGGALPALYQQLGDTGCESLPVVRAYALVAGATYRLTLGPTALSEVGIVIEYVDDFVVRNGRDSDADGFGDPDDVVESPCLPPEGYAPNDLDCDDANPSISPNAVELCGDAVDQNCNGSVDDVGLACHVGEGSCRRMGTRSCSVANGAVTCGAVPGEPQQEICNNADDNCDGSIDEANECTSPTPACIRSGVVAACGCALDADCGPPDSGLVCDVAAALCIEGCSDDPGRNGCPAGASCVESACASESDSPGDESDPVADGCGCRLVGEARSTSPWWALAIVAAICIGRRRLREGRSLALVLLATATGCGSTIAVDEDGGGGQGGATLEPTCALGAKPIEHACSHGTNGEVFDVLVTETPDDAPSVSRVHGVFYVSAPLGEPGWVQLKPPRDGEHVLFTDGLSVVSFVGPGSTSVDQSSLGPPPGCPVFDSAVAITFVEDQPYAIQVQASDGIGGLLYFEHLPSFGAKAWDCEDSE